ncbi:uncharacterized protein BJ171DRAFT_301362 [Polychytrium aggregatum]|uniref:uncharacterized protein n=1 Tax=Polychytrium aggregatum TaxID=110093 RepID=UPI0022FDBD4E|nr:uncharacterized protein BJ171DRAFT_301362 [Polychytrium aggregatum]KAI9193212.1 hypothetical protein BJ171DRAFT_301362 [Polychytrium aggregatum]
MASAASIANAGLACAQHFPLLLSPLSPTPSLNNTIPGIEASACFSSSPVSTRHIPPPSHHLASLANTHPLHTPQAHPSSTPHTHARATWSPQVRLQRLRPALPVLRTYLRGRPGQPASPSICLPLLPSASASPSICSRGLLLLTKLSQS